ncbi:MAG: hypothetical protein JW904_10905 [Spirochaetales bacterium]|nr:hypothetical protein [Spirochaetales bacterium]
MKYELETIPVWDAFKKETECPICVLEAKNEKNNLNFFLGDSVMNPETRILVNEKGFCAYHFGLMTGSDHKLGVGLMAHTHLTDIIAGLVDCEKKSASLLKKAKGTEAAKAFSEYIKNRTTSCAFCDRLQRTLDRYVFTIVYLWRKDEMFKKEFESSKGFCLTHSPLIYTMAAEVLSGKILTEFIEILSKINIQRLETVEKQILWFTQKFDFRNKDKPWNDSKDALIRTLQKLKGHLFLEGKEQEKNG